MIPVMVMGTLVGGKRYSVVEYLCAGLIAGGISLFAAQVSTSALSTSASCSNLVMKMARFDSLQCLLLDGT